MSQKVNFTSQNILILHLKTKPTKKFKKHKRWINYKNASRNNIESSRSWLVTKCNSNIMKRHNRKEYLATLHQQAQNKKRIQEIPFKMQEA